MEKLIEEAADVIIGSDLTLALTGAGISVESGIPDFRSAGGLWSKFDPAEYANISAFRADPEKIWKMLREMGFFGEIISVHVIPRPHLNIDVVLPLGRREQALQEVGE